MVQAQWVERTVGRCVDNSNSISSRPPSPARHPSGPIDRPPTISQHGVPIGRAHRHSTCAVAERCPVSTGSTTGYAQPPPRAGNDSPGGSDPLNSATTGLRLPAAGQPRLGAPAGPKARTFARGTADRQAYTDRSPTGSAAYSDRTRVRAFGDQPASGIASRIAAPTATRRSVQSEDHGDHAITDQRRVAKLKCNGRCSSGGGAATRARHRQLNRREIGHHLNLNLLAAGGRHAQPARII